MPSLSHQRGTEAAVTPHNGAAAACARVLFAVMTSAATLRPWYDDFVLAIDGAHEVALFDPDGDWAEQFENVGAVVDLGGYAPRDLIDVGARAGVRLWQVLGYGLDHIDHRYVRSKNILFAHSPGSCTAVSLAEHAFHLMLTVEKRWRAAQDVLMSGVYGGPFGGELDGQTLGVVGFGASGRALAVRAAAFGMRIVAIDASPPSLPVGLPSFEFIGALDHLDELLAAADYVSLHLPLTDETHHVLDRRGIGQMKASAVVINVARGALIEQEALVDALATGALRGAGLDVFEAEPLPLDHPLLQLEHVALTPHTAGLTRQTSIRRGRLAAANIRSVLMGGDPVHGVVP